MAEGKKNMPGRFEESVDIASQPGVKSKPQTGDRMEDGTIYVCISPNTNKRLYVCPEDGYLTSEWRDAMDFAAQFEGHGKPAGAFRLPTNAELDVLFHCRAKIGGFQDFLNNPEIYYWATEKDQDGNIFPFNMNLKNGRYNMFQKRPCLVRLVRS